MTSTTKDKAREIRDLVERVMHADVGPRVRAADHWGADPHAIGFARRNGSSKIVYVSSWKRPAGTFFWSIESRKGVAAREGVAEATDVIRVIDETFQRPSTARGDAQPDIRGAP